MEKRGKKEAKKGGPKDYGELLMESFVEVVDETVKLAGLKKSEFAQKVWPEASPRAASSKWQSMCTVVTNTGKPQGVLISDAQRMAEVLGQELPYLFLQASLRAKEKGAAQKATAKEPSKRKGTPQ